MRQRVSVKYQKNTIAGRRLGLLQSVRFVVDSDGQKSAVLANLDVWEQILTLLEDLGDADFAGGRSKLCYGRSSLFQRVLLQPLSKRLRTLEVLSIRSTLIQSPKCFQETVRVMTWAHKLVDDRVALGLQFLPERQGELFRHSPLKALH